MTSPLGSFLEGALGGVQQGYQFRTGIEDRKRRIASEDDAAQYERARRLREAVAFELQQKVMQGQLDAQARAAAQGRRLEELAPGATLFDPVAGKPVYTAPGGPANKPAFTPEYVQEGFDQLFPNDPVAAQQAWAKFHERISRAGGTSGERGQVTPRDRFSERTRLMSPHWGVDPATGEMRMQPGVSAAEADRIVREAESGPAPQSPSMIGPMRSGYRGGQPTNVPQGSDITAPFRSQGVGPHGANALGAIADRVIAEHPDWDDTQVSAEVRRRAGIR